MGNRGEFNRGEPLTAEAYSCIGICCSISRQALIFSRRQTQHNGSALTSGVSLPQTPHFVTFLRLSVEIERLASSSIPAGTTASGFVPLRFMWVTILTPLWQKYGFPTTVPGYLTYRPRSRRFRYLHHDSHIEGRSAARTALARRDSRVLALQIDVSGNGVRANRTVNLPQESILNECIHGFLPHFIRRSSYRTGCTKFVKFLEGPGACGYRLPPRRVSLRTGRGFPA